MTAQFNNWSLRTRNALIEVGVPREAISPSTFGWVRVATSDLDALRGSTTDQLVTSMIEEGYLQASHSTTFSSFRTTDPAGTAESPWAN